MGQDGVELSASLGYRLKQAATALRVEMESALRPLGLNISQYSCLELLAQRPGLSNSELARGTFITRQSMSSVLQSLEQDGLVVRPPAARTGRVLPVELTDSGRRLLETASAVVRAVEKRMLADLDPDEEDRARDLLARFIRSLQG